MDEVASLQELPALTRRRPPHHVAQHGGATILGLQDIGQLRDFMVSMVRRASRARVLTRLMLRGVE